LASPFEAGLGHEVTEPQIRGEQQMVLFYLADDTARRINELVGKEVLQLVRA
jgi:hypothetical protein